MCGYFCIGFIDFILKGKRLLDHKNLFSPDDYEKHDKKDIKILSINKEMKKIYDIICSKYREQKKQVK